MRRFYFSKTFIKEFLKHLILLMRRRSGALKTGVIRIRRKKIRSNEEVYADWLSFIELRKKRNGSNEKL